MKNLFRIARWEFRTRFRSRSFLFNTLISPLLFTAVITLPIFFFQYEPEVSTKLIGIIYLSGENIERDLQKELNRYYNPQQKSREYVILKVSVDNSTIYKEKLAEYNEIKSRLDSITLIIRSDKKQTNPVL